MSIQQGPDGNVHEVDVLKLLCLSEIVDYGMGVVTPDTRAACDVTAGDTITFYPGDVVLWAPPAGGVSKVRLLSERHRKSTGVLGPALSLPGGYTIHGSLTKVDANYMGHLLPCDGTANCAIQPTDTAVPIVATRDIRAGEQLYITQIADS